MITARVAKTDDLQYLTERLKESDGEMIDLWKTPCWLAEDENGRIVGMMPIRLVWQFEPLLIFPEVKVKASRRRAGMLMYNAAEDWLRDRDLNGSGIYWAFAITRRVAVRTWLKALGWRHQYKRAPLFIKHF